MSDSPYNRTISCEPTLSDQDVIDFCRNGYLMLPSVVPDVGDISDVAKDGYNSYIINSYSDTSSYADKILGLLTDKDKYMEMSSNSDDYVKRHYTHNSASLVWSQIIGRLN